jgi:hypothetical protein
MSKVIPNKLWKTRAEIEGRAYRMISFFHNNPGEIPEDQWTIFTQDNDKFIVDKLTLSVMAECRCEFLSRSADSESSEPPIVSVRMDIIDSSKKSSEDVPKKHLKNDLKMGSE